MSLASLAIFVGVLASAPVEVHTATRDVRSCRALDGDRGYVAATDGGVVFLDRRGNPETPLTALDGLPETRSYVVERVSGRADQIWVGTEGGLARVVHDPGGDRGGARVVDSWTSPAPIRAVIEHDGRTFVGTWGAGLLELRGDKLRTVAGPEGLEVDRVTDLAIHDGELVVATAGAGAWTLGPTPRPVEGVDGVVWSLAVVGGKLHAGTLVGVRRLDGAASITLGTHDARDLADVDGTLLVGSRGEGLARLGAELDYGLPITHVQGLDGDRCVATPAGLWIRDGRTWTATLTDGLPSGDVTDLLQVGDRLYASTFDRGVAVLEHGRWTTLDGIDPQVNALAPAGGGRVWVATARGLYRAGDGHIEQWTQKQGLPHQAVLSLAISRAGELIVGTHSGVVIVDADGDVRELGSKARRWAVWAVAEAPDGELWLGTTQGLIRWKHDGTWDHLSMLSGHLSDNWVTALAFDGDALHVGTYAGGVDTLAREGAIWRGESLGGGRVNPGGLSVIDGRLHAATMKGVLVRRGQQWVADEPGLFEDATRVLATDGGVWVASRRGLVRASVAR